MVFLAHVHELLSTSFVQNSEGVEANDFAEGYKGSLCHASRRDDGVWVLVESDNTRDLLLEQHPGFVQSRIRCEGPAPSRRTVGWCEDPTVRRSLKCQRPIVEISEETRPYKTYIDYVTRPMLDICQKRPMKALFLGLGGATAQTILHDKCPDSELISVEMRPSVVAAARDFFGFNSDGKQEVRVQDASSALQDFVTETPSGHKFDAALVDISDTVLNKRDWKNLHHLLKPGSAVLHNHTDPEKMNRQLGDFSTFFSDVHLFRLENGPNDSAAPTNVIASGLSRSVRDAAGLPTLTPDEPEQLRVRPRVATASVAALPTERPGLAPAAALTPEQAETPVVTPASGSDSMPEQPATAQAAPASPEQPEAAPAPPKQASTAGATAGVRRPTLSGPEAIAPPPAPALPGQQLTAQPALTPTREAVRAQP